MDVHDTKALERNTEGVIENSGANYCRPVHNPNYYEESQPYEEPPKVIASEERLRVRRTARSSTVEIRDEYTTSIDLPPISWHGYGCVPKYLSMANTGQTLVINGQWSGGRPYIKGGPLNGTYMFSQIHFHSPSEHQLDGKRYPLEMHVIHYKTSYLTQERAMNEKDGTVVLVYLFQTVDTGTDLSNITRLALHLEKGRGLAETKEITLDQILKPFNANYYVYWGKLTTEKNSYILQWIINCNILPVSKQEVEDLVRIMKCDEVCRKKPKMQPENNTVFHVGEEFSYDAAEQQLPDSVNFTCSSWDHRAEDSRLHGTAYGRGQDTYVEDTRLHGTGYNRGQDTYVEDTRLHGTAYGRGQDTYVEDSRLHGTAYGRGQDTYLEDECSPEMLFYISRKSRKGYVGSYPVSWWKHVCAKSSERIKRKKKSSKTSLEDKEKSKKKKSEEKRDGKMKRADDRTLKSQSGVLYDTSCISHSEPQVCREPTPYGPPPSPPCKLPIRIVSKSPQPSRTSSRQPCVTPAPLYSSISRQPCNVSSHTSTYNIPLPPPYTPPSSCYVLPPQVTLSPCPPPLPAPNAPSSPLYTSTSLTKSPSPTPSKRSSRLRCKPKASSSDTLRSKPSTPTTSKSLTSSQSKPSIPPSSGSPPPPPSSSPPPRSSSSPTPLSSTSRPEPSGPKPPPPPPPLPPPLRVQAQQPLSATESTSTKSQPQTLSDSTSPPPADSTPESADQYKEVSSKKKTKIPKKTPKSLKEKEKREKREKKQKEKKEKKEKKKLSKKKKKKKEKSDSENDSEISESDDSDSKGRKVKEKKKKKKITCKKKKKNKSESEEEFDTESETSEGLEREPSEEDKKKMKKKKKKKKGEISDSEEEDSESGSVCYEEEYLSEPAVICIDESGPPTPDPCAAAYPCPSESVLRDVCEETQPDVCEDVVLDSCEVEDQDDCQVDEQDDCQVDVQDNCEVEELDPCEATHYTSSRRQPNKRVKFERNDSRGSECKDDITTIYEKRRDRVHHSHDQCLQFRSQDPTVSFLFSPSFVLGGSPGASKPKKLVNLEDEGLEKCFDVLNLPVNNPILSKVEKSLVRAKGPKKQYFLQLEQVFCSNEKGDFSSCNRQEYNLAVTFNKTLLQEYNGIFHPSKLEVGAYEKVDLIPKFPDPKKLSIRVQDCFVKMESSDQLYLRTKFIVEDLNIANDSLLGENDTFDDPEKNQTGHFNAETQYALQDFTVINSNGSGTIGDKYLRTINDKFSEMIAEKCLEIVKDFKSDKSSFSEASMDHSLEVMGQKSPDLHGTKGLASAINRESDVLSKCYLENIRNLGVSVVGECGEVAKKDLERLKNEVTTRIREKLSGSSKRKASEIFKEKRLESLTNGTSDNIKEKTLQNGEAFPENTQKIVLGSARQKHLRNFKDIVSESVSKKVAGSLKEATSGDATEKSLENVKEKSLENIWVKDTVATDYKKSEGKLVSPTKSHTTKPDNAYSTNYIGDRNYSTGVQCKERKRDNKLRISENQVLERKELKEPEGLKVSSRRIGVEFPAPASRDEDFRPIFKTTPKGLKGKIGGQKKSLYFTYDKIEKDGISGKKVFVGSFRTKEEVEALSKGKKIIQSIECADSLEKQFNGNNDAKKVFLLSNRESPFEGLISLEGLTEAEGKPQTKNPPDEQKHNEKDLVVLHKYKPKHTENKSDRLNLVVGKTVSELHKDSKNFNRLADIIGLDKSKKAKISVYELEDTAKGENNKPGQCEDDSKKSFGSECTNSPDSSVAEEGKKEKVDVTLSQDEESVKKDSHTALIIIPVDVDSLSKIEVILVEHSENLKKNPDNHDEKHSEKDAEKTCEKKC